MSSNSDEINSSPSLSKNTSASVSPSPPPSTSRTVPESTGTRLLEGITEEDAVAGGENEILKKKKKKKVSIETVTLGERQEFKQKWRDNYVPSEAESSSFSSSSENTTSKKSHSTVPKRNESDDKRDGEMAREVTTIFEEVFREERGHWSRRAQYYLACLGVPVAFSAWWRFPLLIANHGGGAFLFCYAVVLLLVGVPLYYMETALGQFAQLSVVHVWRCAPVMQGVGIAMMILSLITSVYNSQMVAYSVHYLFASFVNMDTTILWGECKPSWPKCYDVRSNNVCSFINTTVALNSNPEDCAHYLVPSSRYYWEEKVLRITELGDVGRTGHLHWDLTLCVAFGWLCAFVVLVKGVKSAGKVTLFTAIFPIGVLIAFLVFSVQQEGAQMGLTQFYSPDWDMLAVPKVWQKACEQVLFSLCVTYGSVLTFSSFKKFKSEVRMGAVFLSIANLVLSILAASTIFAMVGALAASIGVRDATTLMKVEVSGIEIVFVLVPEVIARLFPFPHIWAVFFFLMLITMGLHAQFSLIAPCLTSVSDAAPRCRRRNAVHAAASLILPLFLLSIPLSSSTGLHIHSVIESSVIGPNVLLIAIFEIMALQCFYGVKRFSRDLRFILKSEPSIFWKVCWVFVAPFTLTVLFVFAVIDWKRLLFDDQRGNKNWTLYLSWILTLLPLAMIPLTFVFTIFYKLCLKEPVFHPDICWGPGCSRTREVICEQQKILQEARKKLDGNKNEAFD